MVCIDGVQKNRTDRKLYNSVRPTHYSSERRRAVDTILVFRIVFVRFVFLILSFFLYFKSKIKDRKIEIEKEFTHTRNTKLNSSVQV